MTHPFANPNRIIGSVGQSAIVGVFGELLTGEFNNDIAVQFQYSISSYDASTTLTGDGAAGVASDEYWAELTSTTGTAEIVSVDALRYRPGHTAMAYFTASFEGAGDGEIGIFTSEDGFFVRHDSTGLNFVYRRGGSDISVVNYDDFNGGSLDSGNLSLDDTPDWSNIHIFVIVYGYLGVANPSLLFLQPNTNQFTVLHTFFTAGNLQTTHIGNPVLPICAYTSGAKTLRTASWAAGTIGDTDGVGSRPFHWDGTVALSGTNVATLAVFENKSTYQSKTNRVKGELVNMSFAVDAPASGSGKVQFSFIRNPTLSGTPSWTDVDADNSVIRYDTVQTYGSGGVDVWTEWLDYSGGANPNSSKSSQQASRDVVDIGFYLYPGDRMIIIAQNVAGSENVTVRAALNWRELF